MELSTFSNVRFWNIAINFREIPDIHFPELLLFPQQLISTSTLSITETVGQNLFYKSCILDR